jgi:hypothetical protein
MERHKQRMMKGWHRNVFNFEAWEQKLTFAYLTPPVDPVSLPPPSL